MIEFTVLEIGCGFHKQNVDLGIDIIKGSSCDMVADAHHLPFLSNAFTTVIMIEVLDSTESPKKVLNEIHRVLTFDGTLIFSIPNVFYFRSIARWFIKGQVSGWKGHIASWSLSDIDNLLKQCRFRIDSYQFSDRERHNKPSIFEGILPRITRHSLTIKAFKLNLGVEKKA